MQANNKTMGSPVNRINISGIFSLSSFLSFFSHALPLCSARWAVRGIGAESWTRHNDEKEAFQAYSSFVRSKWNYYLFEASLFIVELGFYFTRAVDWTRALVFGSRPAGFEEVLDHRMKEQVRASTQGGRPSIFQRRKRFGIKVDEHKTDPRLGSISSPAQSAIDWISSFTTMGRVAGLSSLKAHDIMNGDWKQIRPSQRPLHGKRGPKICTQGNAYRFLAW